MIYFKQGIYYSLLSFTNIIYHYFREYTDKNKKERLEDFAGLLVFAELLIYFCIRTHSR